MKKNKNNIQTWASLSIMQQNTLGLRALHWIQTIEVEEVVPVEWVLMELVNGHQMLSINVLPQGLLATAAALISNQGLQHGSHHIQLVRKITEVWFYTSLQKPFTENASTLPMKIRTDLLLSLNTERISHSHLNNTISSPRNCLLTSFDPQENRNFSYSDSYMFM